MNTPREYISFRTACAVITKRWKCPDPELLLKEAISDGHIEYSGVMPSGKFSPFDGYSGVDLSLFDGDPWIDLKVGKVSLTQYFRSVFETPAAAKNIGGRPALYNWDEFWVEVCRKVHGEGKPPTQAKWVKELQDWCQIVGWNEIPDDSQIKAKLRLVFKALEWGKI